MIYLTKNKPVQVVLTLHEKSKPDLDYKYFFVWKNKESNEEFFITANDESLYPSIFNLFTFTSYVPECNFSLGTNGYYTATNGEYTYTVYQSNEPENFDITSAVKVETGVLYIGGERAKIPVLQTEDNYHIPVLNEADILVINKNDCNED